MIPERSAHPSMFWSIAQVAAVHWARDGPAIGNGKTWAARRCRSCITNKICVQLRRSPTDFVRQRTHPCTRRTKLRTLPSRPTLRDARRWCSRQTHTANRSTNPQRQYSSLCRRRCMLAVRGCPARSTGGKPGHVEGSKKKRWVKTTQQGDHKPGRNSSGTPCSCAAVCWAGKSRSDNLHKTAAPEVAATAPLRMLHTQFEPGER